MLLRKQAGYNEAFRAKMRFNPSRVGYESGVTLWWNQYSFASIGIEVAELDDGAGLVRRVIAREPTGKSDGPKVPSPLVLGSYDVVQLSIEATAMDYKLTLSAGEVSTSVSFAAEKLTASPPVGGSFTGAMFGIYSFGRSEPVLDPADFWNVEIVERSQ